MQGNGTQFRSFATLAFGIGIAMFGILFTGFAQNRVTQSSAPPAKIDYNWDVKPILSDNCFRCHGPASDVRQANLRLDVAESAHTEMVLGKPDESEIIRRVSSDDPSYHMPPPETHKTLSSAQIAILRKWIEQGAEYKSHWAYIPPVKTLPSAVKFQSRVINDIDRFVFGRLDREGMSPSPEADKETLINRVSMTLTGLPPTLAEVDAFVADKSPKAYESLVDRLLASTAYAEHMTDYWMDVARYAETDGFLDDHHNRFLWPYRDWVISAFNKNMPFDQFSTWQLAGDLMPNPTKEQILATTFLRAGKRTTENGAIQEEYRVEYMLERTDLMGKAFLGMTVACARCHDHKYDPISNKAYYQLSGFFNSAAEPGFHAPGQSTVQGGPTLLWTTPDQDVQIAKANADIKAKEVSYAAARKAAEGIASAQADTLSAKPAFEIGANIRASILDATDAYYSFDTIVPFSPDMIPTMRRSQAPLSLVPEQGGRGGGGGAAPVEAVAGGAAAATATPTAAGAPANATQAAGGGGRGGRGGGRGAASSAGAAANAPALPPTAGGAPPAAAAPTGGFGRGGGVRVPATMDASAADQIVMFPNGARTDTYAIVQYPILRPGPKGKGVAMYLNDTNHGFLGKDIGWYERTREFGFDFWFMPGKVYRDVTVINHRDEDNAGGAGYSLDLENNHIRFNIMHSWPANMLSVLSKAEVPVNQWTHLSVTYDGSSTAAGIKIYINGRPAALDVQQDHLNRSILPLSIGQVFDTFVGTSFGYRFRMPSLADGAIDEIRFFNRALTPVEVSFLHDEAAALAVEPGTLKGELTELAVVTDSRVIQARTALADAREAENKFVSLIPEVLVMADMPKPRPTFMLFHGIYDQRGEQISPRVSLDQILPWNEALPQNRIGLAKWLFDPANPLTSRVFVNRLWQMQFGRGLVDTPDNFGAQGSLPSHPELLDYLAVRFVESGWDIKAMQKFIVMSATYRQKSESSKGLETRDPENRLLARGVRQRMSAEEIRDYALAVSGLLVQKVGGPSVHPYLPDGIWQAAAAAGGTPSYPAPTTVGSEELHRRTLYSYIKRNAPNPELAVFDFPDRNVSTVFRGISNTPLQALAFLNDPQFVEAYRVLAAKVLKGNADKDSQIKTLYRLAIRRQPTASELAALRQFYDSEFARFSTAKTDAEAFLRTGVTPVAPGVDVAQLAALANVTAAVMIMPDSYSIR